MNCHGWRTFVAILPAFGLGVGCQSDPCTSPHCGSSAEVAANFVAEADLPPTDGRSSDEIPTPLPVVSAAYQAGEEDSLPPPASLGSEGEAGNGESDLGDFDLNGSDQPEALPTPEALRLSDVIESVQWTYPPLAEAAAERQIAAGKQLSAHGAFDLMAKAFSISMPEGFYKNYRNGASLEQPTFQGGYLYGGYKIGDGFFQPWFGERETNEGGEFALGFGAPILKNRDIDERRSDLFQANLTRQAVEPFVRTQLLEFVRIASQFYWSWVASGQALDAQRELLENAEDRVEQIEIRVEEGDIGEIVIRGANVTPGYQNNPKANAENFTDGWFRTG
ncbi:MAG: TolC family protein, partial [Planctomycetota bacterium]